MRRILGRAALAVSATGLLALSPQTISPTLRDCREGFCTMRLTAPQLLTEVERLVQERRFDEARPMLVALKQAPEMAMQTNFLEGYVAAETGDLDGAAKYFRAVLRDRPDVTRARLELARVLMMQGKNDAADHHFRLAEEDEELPPEIAKTIRDARGVLSNSKRWHLNVDFGLAPDSNVNNGTDARSIDIPYGDGTLPFTLDPTARRKKGVGQFASVSTGVRLRLSDGAAMLLDADGQVINQDGKSADDISLLLAAGPELTLKNGARVSIQATGLQRWYGGKSATTGGGARISYQQNLDKGSRIGVRLDGRYTVSGFGDAYDGWQLAGYATYERVMNKTMVASVTGFARREDLRADPYSSTEFGINLGMGGELPHGINAGISAGASRVKYDDPLFLLSSEPRKDWRVNARAYLGARSIRVLGFSPSITYTFNRIDSTLPLYQSDRHRVQFALARYF